MVFPQLSLEIREFLYKVVLTYQGAGKRPGQWKKKKNRKKIEKKNPKKKSEKKIVPVAYIYFCRLRAKSRI